MEKKRERGNNFSREEEDLLVQLAEESKSIIENKKSDSITWKEKNAEWVRIEERFNARSGGILRSAKTLKIKYDGLKRQTRKKSSAIRGELYKTGGGTGNAPPLDRVEEKIKDMIFLSVEGMDAVFDSDILPAQTVFIGMLIAFFTRTNYISVNLHNSTENDKVIIDHLFICRTN